MGRTNIEIDDRLVARAMRLTGARTKREVVDIALRRLVDKGTLYRAIRKLRGKLRNALYRNNGDGTFADVTQAAGVGDTDKLSLLPHHQLDAAQEEGIRVAQGYGEASLF